MQPTSFFKSPLTVLVVTFVLVVVAWLKIVSPPPAYRWQFQQSKCTPIVTHKDSFLCTDVILSAKGLVFSSRKLCDETGFTSEHCSGNDDPHTPPQPVTSVVSRSVVVWTPYANNLFHIFNDVYLPLSLIKESDGSSLFILGRTELKAFVVDAGKALGFPKVVAAGSLTAEWLHLESVVVSSRLVGDFFYNLDAGPDSASWKSAQKVRDRVRQHCLNEEIESEKALVILNRPYGGRRIYNAQHAAEFFARSLSMRTVVAETGEPPYKSLCEQVRVIRKASVIVGIHGAGLTLAMFADPGTVLVQILVGRQCNIPGLREFAVNADFVRGRYIEACIREENVDFISRVPSVIEVLLEAYRAHRDPMYYPMDFEGITLDDGTLLGVLRQLHSGRTAMGSR
jgi:hypothetical protein